MRLFFQNDGVYVTHFGKIRLNAANIVFNYSLKFHLPSCYQSKHHRIQLMQVREGEEGRRGREGGGGGNTTSIGEVMLAQAGVEGRERGREGGGTFIKISFMLSKVYTSMPLPSSEVSDC